MGTASPRIRPGRPDRRGGGPRNAPRVVGGACAPPGPHLARPQPDRVTPGPAAAGPRAPRAPCPCPCPGGAAGSPRALQPAPAAPGGTPIPTGSHGEFLPLPSRCRHLLAAARETRGAGTRDQARPSFRPGPAPALGSPGTDPPLARSPSPSGPAPQPRAPHPECAPALPVSEPLWSRWGREGSAPRRKDPAQDPAEAPRPRPADGGRHRAGPDPEGAAGPGVLTPPPPPAAPGRLADGSGCPIAAL